MTCCILNSVKINKRVIPSSIRSFMKRFRIRYKFHNNVSIAHTADVSLHAVFEGDSFIGEYSTFYGNIGFC